MFFSRSNEPSAEAKLRKHVRSEICAFFDVANEAIVDSWFEVESDTVVLSLPFSCASQHEKLKNVLYHHAEQHDYSIDHVVIETKIPVYQCSQPGVLNIKNIIAVSSGKGGVGKSATAVNLAFALMAEGAKVGILDADIYGPSIPTMLGKKDAHPESHDSKTMQPVSCSGLVSNSIGYLVSEEDAAVWRGPMASRALLQLLNETQWPVLDYLIVDMPPGTGDVQLTMAQQVPLTGAVVVTTPQDLALADAQKGISMFNKVSIPVLGLIENMSSFACSNCGHIEYIFSQEGGMRLSERYQLPLLGSLPLSISIREYADAGTPLLIEAKDSLLANQYREIARQMSLTLALNASLSETGDAHVKGERINVQSAD